MAVQVNAAVSATPTLIPGNQSHGWENRWKEVQRDLARLLQARSGTMSGENIRAAERELLSFYVLTYHLKDLVIAETQVSKQAVEGAVNATPALALVCDLANLDKHGHLNQPPRSGHAPAIDRVAGSGLSSGGWVLDLDIQHGSATRDGREVARDAVDAWEQILKRWSLI